MCPVMMAIIAAIRGKKTQETIPDTRLMIARLLVRTTVGMGAYGWFISLLLLF
jgi:hypothetical protein